MLEQIDVFIEQIRLASSSTSGSKGSQPVNMTDLTKRLGADIVGHLAFGYAMNMQTDPTYQFVLRGLAVGSYQNNSFMQFPMLKKLGLHNLVPIVGGFASRMKYRNMLQKMITSRLSQEKHAKNDLYSFVVDHLDRDGSKNGVKTSELWSEALFFFPAGEDISVFQLSDPTTSVGGVLALWPAIYHGVSLLYQHRTDAREPPFTAFPMITTCLSK